MNQTSRERRVVSASENERGFTLIEGSIVLVITTLLISVLTNLVRSSGDSQVYLKRMSEVTQLNQEVLNECRRSLLSSVRVFENDPTGRGVFDALEFGKVPPLDSTKLPTAVVQGNFGSETSAGARTGNSLLLLSQARTTEFQCTSGKNYLVDVLRLRCFYLAKAPDGGPAPDRLGGLALAEFVSEPIADGLKIDEITDPADRAEILRHLAGNAPDIHGQTHPPVTLVWRLGESFATAGALREIDPATNLLGTTPVSPRTSWTIRRASLSRKNLLSRGFSITSNFADPRFGVGRFGKRHATGDGFPHGFEVQLQGPRSSRGVLIHSTLIGTNRKGSKAHSDLRAIVRAQDM